MATKDSRKYPEDEKDWWTSRENVQAIRDFAIQQGLLMKASREPNERRAVNITVTLTPFKFPAEFFRLACNIQQDINSLIDAISRDEHFLKTVLERLVPGKSLNILAKSIFTNSSHEEYYSLGPGPYLTDY